MPPLKIISSLYRYSKLYSLRTVYVYCGATLVLISAKMGTDLGFYQSIFVSL
ncbi:hypothetical protein KsCSTR_10240 [Candidatus Kuenenia stuttgartiensis]|uniref:Uncharacterized protein n=1 Tax=Kuenenia stuttgartiensis TaxID=174633 RepID=Q1PYT1_KUEST|nr:hypothetical protein KsCSTR_10240 [Candidatus Kuenenia stuttgartiensis]CAJ72234.1 unknown protein [Candidatus Kuenenia stuttgartiensis]